MVSKPFRSSAYYEQAKAIKGYVSFKVPTSKRPSQSLVRKVREYHQLIYGKPVTLEDGTRDWITGIGQGGKYPVAGLRGKERKEAQRYAGHGRVKGLKVAFIPWNGKDVPKLKFKNGALQDTTGGQNRTVHLFDEEEFAEDVAAGDYLKHIKKAIREAKGAKAFGVMCGTQETKNLWDREGIIGEVARMIEHYSDQDANDYHGNWLVGIIAYKTKTGKDAIGFRQRRAEFTAKQRKERANAKRRKENQRRKANSRH